MMKKVYQVKISLVGSKPKIWRRLLILSDILLSDFHKVIQTSMGWTNSHLHQFIKADVFYTVRMPDDDLWDEMNNVDYKGIRLNRLIETVHDTIIYEYDFGDSWEHEILLEKILNLDEAIKSPICLSGKMSCPPEDCGGIWGYSEMLKVLKNPNHREYNDYLNWLGENFDYREFDVKKVNKKLEKRNYGLY